MNATDRLSVAGAVAALATGLALTPLTEDRSYLALAAVMIGISVAIGGLLRRARAGEALVRVAQLAPAMLLPVLVPETSTPWRLISQTVEFVQQAFAPMPYQVGFAVFCALLLWFVFLLVETLVIGLQSPGWAFPVLVLPYAISALAIYVEANPFLFGFTAAGYALVLATSVRHAPALSREPDVAVARGWRRGVAAAAVGSTTLALTGMLLLSLPIPERSADWSANAGPGTVQLGDPSLDLIRNVNSNSDRTLITYTTSDGNGHYLRLTALPVFDERGFHLSATDLLPLPMSVDRPTSFDTETVRTSVEVANFASEYLPAPWLPTAASATGDWRYDPRTLAIVAVGDGRRQATQNTEYRVTSERLPAIERVLSDAAEGNPADNGMTLSLPEGISPQVYRLAEQVTADAPTAGEKALALRDFLRSDAFTYSLAAAPGTTLQTLDDFLLGSRIGYCEQFAGSLAVLARMVGIPSRVVVGFLPGTRVDDVWEVSARNMHAWTELHFGDGVGWVPLDPTPGGAVGNPDATATTTATAEPTVTEPTAPEETATESEAPLPPIGGPGIGPGAWGWVAGALGLLLAVVGGPALVRQILRQRRLAGGDDPGRAVEGAWAEVRAVVIDRGGDWPLGTSRQVADQLGGHLGADGGAALRELALLVERARFAAEPIGPVDLTTQVREIERATKKRWANPTAWLRRWWPRSLWPQRPSS